MHGENAQQAAVLGALVAMRPAAGQRVLQRIVTEHADADVREMARQALRRA